MAVLYWVWQYPSIHVMIYDFLTKNSLLLGGDYLFILGLNIGPTCKNDIAQMGLKVPT